MGLKRGLLLFAYFLVLCINELSANITMYTPNAYQYQLVPFLVSDIKYIEFEVQACNDAHVLLQTDSDEEDRNVIEIVIGGWANTQSVIRTVKQQRPPVGQAGHAPLDCNAYRRFWISWVNGEINAGTGSFTTEFTGKFMGYSGPIPTINYFRVSTGWGADGNWILGAECSIQGSEMALQTETFDGTHYASSGVCWYDLVVYDADFYIQGLYLRCMYTRPCLKGLFIMYQGTSIRLLRNNVVKVNGTEIDGLPYDSGTFTVEKPSNSRPYSITLPNAVTILWDGTNAAEIQIAMAYFNDVNGLCGTYTNSQEDDFSLRDGTITDTTSVFVRDWKTGGYSWLCNFGNNFEGIAGYIYDVTSLSCKLGGKEGCRKYFCF